MTKRPAPDDELALFEAEMKRLNAVVAPIVTASSASASSSAAPAQQQQQQQQQQRQDAVAAMDVRARTSVVSKPVSRSAVMMPRALARPTGAAAAASAAAAAAPASSSSAAADAFVPASAKYAPEFQALIARKMEDDRTAAQIQQTVSYIAQLPAQAAAAAAAGAGAGAGAGASGTAAVASAASGLASPPSAASSVATPFGVLPVPAAAAGGGATAIVGPAAAPAAAAAAKAGAAGVGAPRKAMRAAGGEVWRDPTLDEWPDNDFRMFVGDLGNDCSDRLLEEAFRRYPSMAKARVVRDKRTGKSKGFGFVSFLNAKDFTAAMREMQGHYIGNRPCKLRKSVWQDRSLDVRRAKDREEAHETMFATRQ